MPDHNIFMGTPKADDIKDNPSPSFLDGKLRCSVTKSDSLYADACLCFEKIRSAGCCEAAE